MNKVNKINEFINNTNKSPRNIENCVGGEVKSASKLFNDYDRGDYKVSKSREEYLLNKVRTNV